MICVRFLPDILEKEFGYLEDYWKHMPTLRQNDFFHMEQENVIGLFIWLAMFSCLIISIYMTCENFQEMVFYSVVLGSGLATRIVVGFSPSVYVSGIRTFYFLDILIIFCMGFLLKKYYNKISADKLRILQGGMGILAVFNVFNTLGGM